MSDQINSLIHTNAVMAFQQGEKTERNRIIEIIRDYGSEDFTAELIALIKGDEN